jgi:hypothetical protein
MENEHKKHVFISYSWQDSSVKAKYPHGCKAFEHTIAR